MQVNDKMVEAACDAAYKAINKRDGIIFSGIEKRPVPPEIQEWMRTALTAALATVNAEPVAWLCTSKNTGGRDLRFKPIDDLPFNRERWTWEPLYAAPQASSPVAWEQLAEVINAGYRAALRTGKDYRIDANKLREFARSALVEGGEVTGRFKVPEGQTPLNDKLDHPLLDAVRAGEKARDEGTSSPYHGHSLEHCLHAIGWVSRDLRLVLDKAKAATPAPAEERVVEAADETTVRLFDFANGDYSYPAYRGRPPEGTPTLKGDIRDTLDRLAALKAQEGGRHG
ncbi:hypothetical protein [Pseudaminobacter sp. NGMCC 1.201702]|uniref:hypothetical protein n=1 Tax=Pseudaminobacter sp. NGMCC 1.201702 TaxID=3391825 RepID=UPI0039F0ADE5